MISAHGSARERHGVLSRAGASSLYDPGVLRALLIVTCLVGCKKKEREMATELPPTPSTGHSITHFKDASDPVGEGSSGSAATASAGSAVPVDAPPLAKPAYKDAEGRIHGPGGPVNMGKGPDCDAAHDHCMRDGVWFAAGNYVPGKLFRATPCFELDGKWYDFRGEAVDDGGKLFKTRVAKVEDVHAGEPLVLFMPTDDGRDKWTDVEADALTSSRWDVGVPDSVNPATKTFTTKAWPDPIDIDAARVIVEQKPH